MHPTPELPVLLAADHPPHHLERRATRGELVRLRRGAYAPSPPDSSREAMAIARIRAVIEQLTLPFVLSHQSAALWWGLPVVGDISRTHVIQRTRPGGRHDPRLIRHVMALDPAECTVRHGAAVTTRERTVFDCARAGRFGPALVVADAAVRAGADPAVVTELIGRHRGRRGVANARAVAQWVDGGSESPGESLTRAVLIEAGLPPVATQVPVRTHRGEYRIDMGWPGRRVGIEFDGRVKYSGAFGESPERALFREKRRHDSLTESGWRLLRVTWSDLSDPVALVTRVNRVLHATSVHQHSTRPAMHRTRRVGTELGGTGGTRGRGRVGGAA